MRAMSRHQQYVEKTMANDEPFNVDIRSPSKVMFVEPFDSDDMDTPDGKPETLIGSPAMANFENEKNVFTFPPVEEDFQPAYSKKVSLKH